MNKGILKISLKMILVASITLIIAYFIGISNYTTASAIAILSVQWTRKDFFSIALKRILSGVIAIVISALLFYFLGNTFLIKFLIFILFMSVFILISWYLNAPEGIVPSLVIVAHLFLIDTITFRFVIEEILLLVIAILVAFVINMIYPQYNSKQMNINLLKVDRIIEDELQNIVCKLKNIEQNLHIDPFSEINSILIEAKMIDRDIILQNDHRYITYLYMRDMQLKVLKNISLNVDKITYKHDYIQNIADYLDRISTNISFYDRATPLLSELTSLNEYFINEKLPTTRKEFETRAILFQILSEISSFLQLKTDFHKKYPNFMEEGH